MVTDFFKKLSNDLTNLLENGEDYNVLIEVGQMPNSKTFKAHSTILNSRCSYFREELIKTSYEGHVKKIRKPDISVKVFETIIKYIYGGIMLFDGVDASTTLNLLTIANEFGFEELIDTMQSQLVNNHASWMRRNFTKVYKLSLENDNFKILQQFYNDIIVKHPSVIFDSEDFTNLSEKALVSLLKLDNLKMDEGKIWDYVIKWGIAQNTDLDSNPAQWSDAKFLILKTILQNCLPHIRFFQISGDDVMEKLYPYQKILEPNLWKDIMAKFISPNKTIVTSTILPPRIISDETLPPRNLKTSSESDTSFTNSSINTSLYNSSPNSSEINLVTKNPSNLGLIDFDTLKATTNLTTLSLFDFAITNPPDPFDFGTQSAMTNSPTLNLIDLGTQNTTTNLSTFESNTIIALYDFMADHNNELSFMAGDSLVLKQRSTHNGWLVAELNGVTGLVPENYFI